MRAVNDVFQAMASGKTDTTLLSGVSSQSGASVYRHAWKMAVGLPDLTGSMSPDLQSIIDQPITLQKLKNLRMRLKQMSRLGIKLTDGSLDEILESDAFNDSSDFCGLLIKVREDCKDCSELQEKLTSIVIKVVLGFEKVVPLPDLNIETMNNLLPITKSLSELRKMKAFLIALGCRTVSPQAAPLDVTVIVNELLELEGFKESDVFCDTIKAEAGCCSTIQELQEKLNSVHLFAGLILEGYMTPIIGEVLRGCNTDGYVENIALKQDEIKMMVGEVGLSLFSLDVYSHNNLSSQRYVDLDPVEKTKADYQVALIVSMLARQICFNADLVGNIQVPRHFKQGDATLQFIHYDYDITQAASDLDPHKETATSIENLMAELFTGFEGGISDYDFIARSVQGHELEQDKVAWVEQIIETLFLSFSKEKVEKIKMVIESQNVVLDSLGDALPEGLKQVMDSLKLCINSVQEKLIEKLDLMRDFSGFAEFNTDEFDTEVYAKSQKAKDKGSFHVESDIDIAGKAMTAVKEDSITTMKCDRINQFLASIASTGDGSGDKEDEELARACDEGIACVSGGSKHGSSPRSVMDSPGPGQLLFSPQPPVAPAPAHPSPAQPSP